MQHETGIYRRNPAACPAFNGLYREYYVAGITFNLRNIENDSKYNCMNLPWAENVINIEELLLQHGAKQGTKK